MAKNYSYLFFETSDVYKKENSFIIAFNWHLFFGCNRAVKNPIAPISNIDMNFPITEKLEFKLFNKYDILERGGCTIDDSITVVY